MATGSSVTIEVLTEGRDDIVTLRGPSLPFRGASWGGKQAVATTWYAGNPTATQQVFGPQEVPKEWEGIWRRTLMGKAPALYEKSGSSTQITSPFALMTLLEEISREGHRLRVTWAAITRERTVRFSRVGRIVEWDFPVDTVDDIHWKMKFEWMGRAGAEVPRVVSTRKSGFGEIVSVLDASVNETASIIDGSFTTTKVKIPKAANHLTLGQLEALANAPNKLLQGVLRSLQQQVSSIKRVVDIADKIRRTPLQLSNQILDFARNTVAIAAQFRWEIGREPAELHTYKNNVADLLRTSHYLARSTESISRSQTAALDFEQRANERALRTPGAATMRTKRGEATHRDILGVHVVRTGDTPQSVSRKWYGSSDSYYVILRANRLSPTSAKLVVGRQLVIPLLVTGPQGV